MSRRNLPVTALDDIARSYRGRFGVTATVLPETRALALVLLVNGNTSQEHALWLADLDVDDIVCSAAEAFVRVHRDGIVNTGYWRGGALASLRKFVPKAVHEDMTPWPWSDPAKGVDLTGQVWIDREPVRARLIADLHGTPLVGEAFDALRDKLRDRMGRLAGWDSAHESPYASRQLRSELAGAIPVHYTPKDIPVELCRTRDLLDRSTCTTIPAGVTCPACRAHPKWPGDD